VCGCVAVECGVCVGWGWGDLPERAAVCVGCIAAVDPPPLERECVAPVCVGGGWLCCRAVAVGPLCVWAAVWLCCVCGCYVWAETVGPVAVCVHRRGPTGWLLLWALSVLSVSVAVVLLPVSILFLWREAPQDLPALHSREDWRHLP
jgi:hypothetical protein